MTESERIETANALIDLARAIRRGEERDLVLTHLPGSVQVTSNLRSDVIVNIASYLTPGSVQDAQDVLEKSRAEKASADVSLADEPEVRAG